MIDYIKKTSVIVPVYNVERFLGKAVESVLKQTYKNFEIILVDDGSTDSSGDLCDYYAKIDNRIRVIHKKNGGQGMARNIGLSVSVGRYVAFLDSDDFWHEKYLESLVCVIENENADMAVCQFEYIDESDIKIEHKRNTGKADIFSGTDAIKEMLYWKKFGVAPWAKLYKRELWEGVRFAEDRIYEDLATTYKVVANAKKVVFIDSTYMFYRVRKGSDAHRPFEEKKMKMLDTASEILEYTEKFIPEVYCAAKSRMVATAFFLLFQIPKSNPDLKHFRADCIKQIYKYRWEVVRDSDSRKKTRMAAGLSYFGIAAVELIYKYMKKKNPVF